MNFSGKFDFAIGILGFILVFLICFLLVDFKNFKNSQDELNEKMSKENCKLIEILDTDAKRYDCNGLLVCIGRCTSRR